MSKTHDRMLVIFYEIDEDKWLNPELRDASKLVPLLAPYPSDVMDCCEVFPGLILLRTTTQNVCRRYSRINLG